MLRTRIIASVTGVLILSAVFASAGTLINRIELFIEPLRVEPERPALVALRIPLRVGFGDSSTRPVVAPGATVSNPELAQLVRDFESARRPPRVGDLGALWLVLFLVSLMLAWYLRALSPGRGALIRTQLGLMVLATAFLVAAKAFLLFTAYPPYALPISAFAIWTTLFLDRRAALIASLAISVLVSSLVGFQLMAVAVFVTSSLAAVYTVGRDGSTARVLVAGGVAALVAMAMYVAVSAILGHGVDLEREFAAPGESRLLASAIGGVLGGVLAWMLSATAVRVLGGVSRSRLLELSDLNQQLLKRIAEKAPGSWEHSRAMANLAEAAANSIGADALLTRVGAYYHDLGKSCQANFFVENLEPGEASPHADLPPDVSADAIVAHVVEGVNILRRGNIPEPVIEFAYTHHGTSVIEYFWHKTMKAGNPRKRDETFFRYPGMRPRTKETAILMIVDSIEAASRTVQPPSREKFDEMVQRIVFVKLRQGQLDESGLSLAELRTISNRIVDSLCSIYHSRIKYPWQDRKDGDSELPLPSAATEEEVREARQMAESRELDTQVDAADPNPPEAQ